jgi:hypothetical protein
LILKWHMQVNTHVMFYTHPLHKQKQCIQPDIWDLLFFQNQSFSFETWHVWCADCGVEMKMQCITLKVTTSSNTHVCYTWPTQPNPNMMECGESEPKFDIWELKSLIWETRFEMLTTTKQMLVLAFKACKCNHYTQNEKCNTPISHLQTQNWKAYTLTNLLPPCHIIRWAWLAWAWHWTWLLQLQAWGLCRCKRPNPWPNHLPFGQPQGQA